MSGDSGVSKTLDQCDIDFGTSFETKTGRNRVIFRPISAFFFRRKNLRLWYEFSDILPLLPLG